jgi:hypothetical protein
MADHDARTGSLGVSSTTAMMEGSAEGVAMADQRLGRNRDVAVATKEGCAHG